MDAAKVVVHECDLNQLPEGYKFIEYRDVTEFDHVSYIQKNIYMCNDDWRRCKGKEAGGGNTHINIWATELSGTKIRRALAQKACEING